MPDNLQNNPWFQLGLVLALGLGIVYVGWNVWPNTVQMETMNKAIMDTNTALAKEVKEGLELEQRLPELEREIKAKEEELENLKKSSLPTVRRRTSSASSSGWRRRRTSPSRASSPSSRSPRSSTSSGQSPSRPGQLPQRRQVLLEDQQLRPAHQRDQRCSPGHQEHEPEPDARRLVQGRDVRLQGEMTWVSAMHLLAPRLRRRSAARLPVRARRIGGDGGRRRHRALHLRRAPQRARLHRRYGSTDPKRSSSSSSSRKNWS